MVGKQAEASGIIKHGAKLLQVLTNANIPKITLLMGASFGAGSYAMCQRAFDPDFIFAWPNQKLAVMGPKQASFVMSTLAKKKGKPDSVIQEEKLLLEKPRWTFPTGHSRVYRWTCYLFRSHV